MGANNLTSIGTSVLRAVGSQLDQYFTAFSGVLVPRNSSGVPETKTQDMGSSTYKWKDIHNNGAYQNALMAEGGVMSFGNGKDGTKSVTADYPTGVMGGEYWFDTFTIDADITVDDTIGWLVIRANTINVTKAGGATIDGQGNSACPIDTTGTNAGTYPRTDKYESAYINKSVTITTLTGGVPAASYPIVVSRALQITKNANAGLGIAGMAGSSGAGGASNLDVSTWSSYSAGGCIVFGVYKGLNIPDSSTYYDNIMLGGAGVTGNNNGNAGQTPADVPSYYYNALINNPINFGQSSPSSSCGADEGGASTGGVSGVKGGAGIALFAKNLTLTENITLDSDGEDGLNGSAGGEVGSGASGGGGAGSNLIAYVSKTGSGTITQTASGGAKGTGGVGTADGDGGDGGDGANGLTVQYDIANNTVTVV